MWCTDIQYKTGCSCVKLLQMWFNQTMISRSPNFWKCLCHFTQTHKMFRTSSFNWKLVAALLTQSTLQLLYFKRTVPVCIAWANNQNLGGNLGHFSIFLNNQILWLLSSITNHSLSLDFFLVFCFQCILVMFILQANGFRAGICSSKCEFWFCK